MGRNVFHRMKGTWSGARQAGGDVVYEVTLGPAAQRFVLGMKNPNDRKELADALREELGGGPNELRFDSAGRASAGDDPGAPAGEQYRAVPLTFGGYTAVYRSLTRDELRQLRREQGRPVAKEGFFLFDILSPESAWIRSSRLF
jgi:hypothetical protein